MNVMQYVSTVALVVLITGGVCSIILAAIVAMAIKAAAANVSSAIGHLVAGIRELRGQTFDVSVREIEGAVAVVGQADVNGKLGGIHDSLNVLLGRKEVMDKLREEIEEKLSRGKK